MGQLDIYQEEIINFLKTVTIKFEPFAWMMGETIMKQYGYSDPHGSWNPYYINLAGGYSSTDTPMTVYSVEEERHVPFTTDLASLYPKTAFLYKVGTTEYTTLQERYPENIGLIQSIVYPVSDIQSAIDAENLTLLAYDDTYLDYNERESLVNCLKSFLTMVRTRWWVPEYTYEDMYAVTFWSMLWQHLPLLLLTQRFLNIKTPAVHTYHIWEFLISKGLGDYRDVLTNNQALWLYRNIEYVLKNKGKHSNLIILAENLLEEIFVTLLYKDMYQETASKASEYISNPEFRSFNIVTGEEVMVESFATLNGRLLDIGVETESGIDYELATEKTLANHNFNVLQTKFLEFKKESIDTSTEKLMVTFFLDTLNYWLSENSVAFDCSFTDPLTGTILKMDVSDAVLLWHWVIQRSIENTPEVIPTSWYSKLAFVKEEPTASDLTYDIWYAGNKTLNTNLIDLQGILDLITWSDKSFVSQDDFVDFIVTQLRAITKLNRYWDQSNKLTYHLAMSDLLYKIRVHSKVECNLTTEQTYGEWLVANPDIQAVIEQYEALESSTTQYETLSETLFDSIFPLDDSELDEFLGNVRNMESVYASVRDLFIQLCSYNVTYLETDRDDKWYIKVAESDIASFVDTTLNMGSTFDIILSHLEFQRYDTNSLVFSDIDIPITASIGNMNLYTEWEKDIGLELDISKSVSSTKPVTQDPSVATESHVVKLYRQICGTNITAQKEL